MGNELMDQLRNSGTDAFPLSLSVRHSDCHLALFSQCSSLRGGPGQHGLA